MGKNGKSHGLILEDLFADCGSATGHCCPGQTLGIRMAVLALRAIGIEDPKGKDKGSLTVVAEIDRCATDAIQYVTGCSLGKRTLRFVDYGKMAGTFINVRSQVAVRVIAREQARDAAKKLLSHMGDKYRMQTEAYKTMPDSDLFEIRPVIVSASYNRLPERVSVRVPCDRCGEYVQDRKEVRAEGMVLCRACAEGAYYKPVEEKRPEDREAAAEHRGANETIGAKTNGAGTNGAAKTMN